MENYELQRELAVIALRIQDAKRELEALRAEKTSFLEEREADAQRLISKAHKEAKSIIDETAMYTDTVKDMQHIISDVLLTAQSIRKEMKEHRETYTKTVKEQTDRISSELETLSAKKKELQREGESIKTLMQSLASIRTTVQAEQKKVHQDRKKLRTAIELAKKKYGIKG